MDFLEGGLAPGKSTYFSLEGAVSLTCEGESCTSGPPSEGAATSLTTSLSGGGQEGAEITVPAGAAVTDQATLAGENASSAEGTVSYAVYSDPECSELAADAGTVKVSEGEAAPSEGAEVGASVAFWGAQWRKLNPLSGGFAPAAFKGFAASPEIAACGETWTARPGNSTPPPAGPLPAYIPVIVTSEVSQSGSTISGDTVHVELVKVNPGYSSNPGHPGTGTIVSELC